MANFTRNKYFSKNFHLTRKKFSTCSLLLICSSTHAQFIFPLKFLLSRQLVDRLSHRQIAQLSPRVCSLFHVLRAHVIDAIDYNTMCDAKKMRMYCIKNICLFTFCIKFNVISNCLFILKILEKLKNRKKIKFVQFHTQRYQFDVHM